MASSLSIFSTKSVLLRVLWCCFAGFLGCGSLWGQVQRYPADVHPMLAPPHTVFLSDYTAAGSDKLSANVIFNDFNEAAWTFKLRLSIESMDVRLRTKDGFTPSAPITVQPGVPFTMKGSDWVEYFNFSNLEVNGRNTSLIVNSGRLPEGMYSFCFQVLDYTTGEVLSAESCRTVWIQLLDPPQVVGRNCGEFLDPATSTNINFNWQLFNTRSANDVAGTDFELTMWELTEPGVDPLSALQNGQALEVFQSGLLSNTHYNYGPADPLLEAGKTYIYRIQATDADGKDRYKNNGYSEFCYFHYGWPVGGSISLLFPADGGGFKRRDQKGISWSSPDNLVRTQRVSYEVEIKELNAGQDTEEAIVENKLWYYKLTSPTDRTYAQTDLIPEPDIEQGYVWRVKAFTGDLKVAESATSVFYGPSLVERFYAGSHRIEVDYLSNKDLGNLAGGGKIRLQNADIWTSITFSGLSLRQSGSFFILEGGEILIDTQPIRFELAALNEGGGTAAFAATGYKVNKNGLFAEGSLNWDLPFPLISGGPGVVRSEKIWSDFNNFTVSGSGKLDNGNSFELLDPFGFRLDLSPTSEVFINSNRFWCRFDGIVTTPSAKSVENKPATWAFSGAESLRTIQVSGPVSSVPLRVVAGTGISLQPGTSIIDLDDQSSPGKFSANPYWKGIYIEQSVLEISEALDEGGQFTLNASASVPVDLAASPASVAAITGAGFSLKHEMAFTIEGVFNTFPATFTGLTLDIANQQVNEASRLRGSFLVPFVDVATPLNFESQLASRGFRPGVLANLSGRTFRFNPDGGELAVDLAIKKGEMAGNNRLQMTLDVSWPSLNITLAGVNNFCVWGDRSVGFFVPEGIVALDHQVTATFKGYPVTIDALSAGRSKNFYGLAVSGKVVMGEDVSGDDGPPAFNLYSMVQNPLLDASYTPAPTQAAFNLAAAQNGLDKLEAELAAFEEDLTQKIEQETAALESTTTDLIASASAGLGGQAHTWDELVTTEEDEQPDDLESIADRKERLIAYMELFRDFSDNPALVDDLIGQVRNSEEDFDNVSDVVAELKRFATSFAVDQVASLGEGFLQKVDKVNDDVNGTIIREVGRLTSSVHNEVDQAVGNIVAAASVEVIASLGQDAPDAALLVQQMGTSTQEAIVNEITISINSSVNQNIVFPVTSFVSSNLSERAHRLVRQTAEQVVLGALNQDQNPGEIMKGVLDGFDDELQGLGDELAAQVDLDKVLEAIKKTGQDAVANISARRIANNIKQAALAAVAGAVAQKGTEALSGLTNSLLSNEIGISMPVDFAAIGGKLLAGGSPKDLLFDPIPIKVRSPVLDLNGIIQFTPDHPQFGNMWAGDVTAFVKKPKPFEIQLAYMNGRKDGVSFWMAEVGSPASAPTAGDRQQTDFSQIGKHMDNPVKEIANEIELGVVKIAALKGRVYHHMAANALESVAPDASNKYGAYLHMVAFGPQEGKMLRLEIDAQMDVATTGDFTVDFAGNAQMLSRNPTVMAIDPTAIIQGTILLKYNSAEQHFFGHLAAKLEQPGVLCAAGSLLVDVKPWQWRVALGSQEERLKFVLNCAGFGPTGWLDLNQNTANLGLGLEFMFRPDPINLNAGIAKVGLLIDAGAAAGIQTTVQYDPNFMLLEAGLWMELWANILLSYETLAKKGTVNLVSIYLAADANMHFNPAPTYMYGKARGQVRVLFLDFGFNKDFRMNM